jgi:Xaa-Pro dipeptidase
MVIMLEPGIYIPGETSVRLEDGLLITADGVEILTKHDKSLP